MLLRKQGFPEESEIVLCTVTTVRYNSVFVTLDEYGRTGMIHISEVSPGRIRNIRDFVKEGKVVICKVLSVNREKGYIDLSLRRVNEGQRRDKVNEIKKEQKAEKILEFVAKKLKRDPKGLYDEVTGKVFTEYDLLSSCFDDIIEKKTSLEKLGVSPALVKELTEVIEQRIKPEEVSIAGKLKLISYAPDGVEVVKEAIKSGERKGITIKYLGAGKYKVDVIAPDYKVAEKILKESTDAILATAEKRGAEASFERQ